ncbi:hypothetical protein ACK3TF_005999 [Chlorella vulgaris]
MARKELLVMGFRHGKTVLKGLRARAALAAQGKALGSAKPHTGESLGKTGSPAANPTHAAAPGASGFLARLAGSLPTGATAAATAAGAARLSPSFAASALWGSRAAAPLAQAAKAAPPSAPRGATAAAATTPAAAVASNPLYRFAKLGAGSGPAVAGRAQAASKKLSPDQALAGYARLGAKPTPQAAPKLNAAAALLRFAKLAK